MTPRQELRHFTAEGKLKWALTHGDFTLGPEAIDLAVSVVTHYCERTSTPTARQKRVAPAFVRRREFVRL